MCKKNAFSNLFYLKRAGEFSRVDFKQKPGSPVFPVIPSIFASPGVYIYTYINVYTSIYPCSGLIVCPPWWIQIKWGRGRTILPKNILPHPRTCSRRFPRHLLWPVVWFTRGSLAVNYQGTLGVLYSPWVIYRKCFKRTFRNEVWGEAPIRHHQSTIVRTV